MLYSVVTVVRDDVDGLRATHASLRRQSLRTFSWIVVDGGSGHDATAAYMRAHRRDIAWMRSGPDGGIYDAMNQGLAQARDDYVLFLNAGDLLSGPETLARLAAAIERAGRPDFLYGDAFDAEPGGRLLLKRARPHTIAWYGMFTHHQSMLYRRAALGDLRFDIRLPVGADYAFTLEVLGRAQTVARVRFPVSTCAPAGISRREHRIGRKDQRTARRTILKLDWGTTLSIDLLKWSAMTLRIVAPDLFRRLRYRKGPASQGSGIRK